MKFRIDEDLPIEFAEMLRAPEREVTLREVPRKLAKRSEAVCLKP